MKRKDNFADLSLKKPAEGHQAIDHMILAGKLPEVVKLPEAKVILAPLMHVVISRFIKEIWNDHNSFYGISDAIVSDGRILVVIRNRIVEIVPIETEVAANLKINVDRLRDKLLFYSSSKEAILTAVEAIDMFFIKETEVAPLMEEAARLLTEKAKPSELPESIVKFYGL